MKKDKGKQPTCAGNHPFVVEIHGHERWRLSGVEKEFIQSATEGGGGSSKAPFLAGTVNFDIRKGTCSEDVRKSIE
jgi:hypothetical protein